MPNTKIKRIACLFLMLFLLTGYVRPVLAATAKSTAKATTKTTTKTKATAKPKATASPEATAETDKNYKKGQKYYKAGKYFSAYECFKKSKVADAKKKAKKCIQKWPKNSEVWRSDSAKAKNMELTFIVDQPDDYAYFIRLYKSDKLVSCVFIGGSGKVKVKLPAGKYTIKDGTGQQWFGVKEAFGRSGHYETMTINGSTVVNLQKNHSYTISINIAEPDPNGEIIYPEEEDWDNFAEDL